MPAFVNNANATFRRVNVTSSSATPVAMYHGSASVIWEDTDAQMVLTFGGVGPGAVGLDVVQLLRLMNSTGLGVCKQSKILTGETCLDYAPLRSDTEALWGVVDTSKSAGVPAARSSHSAVSPSGSVCVYVFGGLDPQTGSIYGDLWRLCPDGSPDPSTFWSSGFNTGNLDFVWTEITPASSFLPTPRYGHIMNELTLGRLLVHGGSGVWPNLYMSKDAEYDIGETARFGSSFITSTPLLTPLVLFSV